MTWGIKRVPLLIAAASIALACALHIFPRVFPAFESIDRLEWITYDWRVRQAAKIPAAASDKLAFVHIGDDAINIFGEGTLGTNLQFGLYWPRHLYGRIIRELNAQGAATIGLDVLFGESRPDHPPVATSAGPVPSDDFFAQQLKLGGNVILGATPEVVPHPLFRTNATALGDISTDRDADGVLRRIRVAHSYRIWHPLIAREARLNDWELDRANIATNEIVIPRKSHKPARIEITEDGLFDPTQITSQARTRGFVRLLPAFEDVRVWHLGVVLAARALKSDLSKARLELEKHRAVLPAEDGVEHVLPVDAQGRLLINWSIRQNDTRLTAEAFESLVAKDILRELGTNHAPRFKDKLVIVGSVASGNELSDRGATPLDNDTFLTSNHWNVMNSILTRRFVRQSSLGLSAAVIAVLGIISAWITVRFPTLAASAAVLTAAILYAGAATLVFVQTRTWLPIISPVIALLLTHIALMSYQAFFEQTERHRIRQIFSKIVSPNVVSELLRAEKLSLVGTRRKLTIMFADVRGFTQITDLTHAQAEEYVLQHQLPPAEAEAYMDRQSEEILRNVNLYLGLIADTVKRHEGTLDKYIGDCVMAFWGAPTPNDKHALACVRAAIEAQRAIETLNRSRAASNRAREAQNVERATRGEPALPLFQTLSLGIGINTGIVTVGLMGSDEHLVNFTIFGRDVNLAARLEASAGGDHIMIGESTYRELLRHDPALAAACIELAPISAKGIRGPVKPFEVNWRNCAPAAERAA